MKNNAGTGGLYGLGVFGALVYFISTSTSFFDGLMGIAMALLWPAVIVYKVLELLKL